MSNRQTKSPTDDHGGALQPVILLPEAVLVNGGSDGLLSGTAIRVDASRIAELGEAAHVLQAYPDAAVLELAGCLVMLGLVNAHQHCRGLTALQQGTRDDFRTLAGVSTLAGGQVFRFDIVPWVTGVIRVR